MKILVTADWHIGKKLHNQDLSADIHLFFQWLLNTIVSERISYLLIAGDIFDSSNPSNEATRQYYTFLKELKRIECKAIIIAGNHDSPSFIDVPKELLTEFDIHVFGLFPGIEHVDKIFVPLKNEQNAEVAVVAAIPFLQDRFIRQVGEGEGAKEIAEKIKQGMKTVFMQIGAALKESYPSIPKIGIAHLHAQGTQINDAERDIQIGNQEGIPSDDLNQFDYLALGHIHTGQTIIKGKIQYASSPINLSFSENRYNHKVIILEIDNNQIKESELAVPKFRSLYQIEGTLNDVEEKVKQLKNKYQLQALLDIKIIEENYDPLIIERLDALKIHLSTDDKLKIVQHRINYTNNLANRFSSTYNTNALEDLKPEKVFKDLIINREEQEQKKLLELFTTLYSDLNNA
jgi:exonuclease SbcD